MSVLKKIFTGTVIAAATLGTLAGAAQARDWAHDRGYGYGQRAPAYGYHRPAPHYGYAERRDRRGERIATGVAIGVGALILGSILANEARRSNHYRGY